MRLAGERLRERHLAHFIVKRRDLIRNFVQIIGATPAALALAFLSSPQVRAQTNPVNVANAYYPFGYGWMAVAVSGNYLYAGNWFYYPGVGLHILDISNPSNPIDIGYTNGSSACHAITISGNYAYATRDSDLDILDISSPGNPVVVGYINSGVNVTLSSHYAYFASESFSSPSGIYDASNPTNLVYIGSLPPASSIAVLENYAYLAGPNPGLSVYDVSNPANSTNVALVQPNNDPPFQVLVSGDYVYLTTLSNNLRIFDISNRTNPIPITYLSAAGGSITLSGNYAYLVDSFNYSFNIYDVSNPTNAYRVASVQLPYDEYGRAVTVSRNYAYIAETDGIGIYSLGSPAPPPLEISPTGNINTISLSWPAPSAAFAVQQNSNLTATGWVTLTNTPVTVVS